MIPHRDHPDVARVLSDIDAGDLDSLPILADALEDAGANPREVLKLRIFLRTRYRPRELQGPRRWAWSKAMLGRDVLPERIFNNLRMWHHRSGGPGGGWASYDSAALAVWDAATCTYF